MARIFKVSPEEAFRLAGWLPRIPETEQTWLRGIEAQLLMLDRPSRYALESYLCYLVEVEMEQEEPNLMRDRFAEWLQEELSKRDWSQADLARRSGTTSGQISRVLTTARGAGSEFCLGVARAFNMSPVDVFRKAGILPPAPKDDPHLLNLLHLARRLRDGDLDRLLVIARALVEHSEIGQEEMDDEC
jgi:transcriptional regulator with XRE-family HTH domain